MLEGLEKHAIKMVKSPKVTEFIGKDALKEQAELKRSEAKELKYMDGWTVQFDGVFLALGIATLPTLPIN